MSEPIPAFSGEQTAMVANNALPQLSPTQRKFQKLSRQVEGQKAYLIELKDVLQRLQSRAAGELLPIHERFTLARRALVQAIDAAFQEGVKLGRNQRRNVVSWLLQLCDALLSEDREDEPTRAVYDRHSDLPWQQMHSDRSDFLQAFEDELMRNMFGDEVVDVRKGDGFGDFLSGMEADGGAAPSKPQRKPSKRQLEKQAQREREEREASQSVREIYRKLASAVHPDREVDAERKAQRTELMQRINSAYEANDLLALLALQRQAEGFAAEEAMNASEERLKIFVRLLKEQVEALTDEVNELLVVLRSLAGAKGRWMNRATDFEADFEIGLREAKRELRLIENDLSLARSPATVSEYLRSLAETLRLRNQRARREPRGANRW